MLKQCFPRHTSPHKPLWQVLQDLPKKHNRLRNPPPLPIQQSAKHRGTEYEHFVIHHLLRYGIRAVHTGGKGDNGVDFRGYWYLDNDTCLPVIGQCKRRCAWIGPSIVREFAATLAREKSRDMVGLVCVTGGYSNGALKEFNQAACGMVLTRIPLAGEYMTDKEREWHGANDGKHRVGEVVWNMAASRSALGHLESKRVPNTKELMLSYRDAPVKSL